MSGHSKWANIKRKKGVNDAQRSAVFTKMSRIVSTAVHEGGGIGDPGKNVRLRLAIDRARAVNMPKDTIQRAIDKAMRGEGAAMREMMYEGFGPGGVGLMIAVTTDNANRTHAEVKHILERNGGKMASPNAVAHQFEKCGVVEFDKDIVNEQSVFGLFDQLGGLDLEEDEQSYILYIPFEQLGKVKEGGKALELKLEPKSIDVFYRPTTTISLAPGEIEKVTRLVEKLEDLDDVMNVYVNNHEETL